MAIRTDKRGRRYQNDAFRKLKEGDTIYTLTFDFMGVVRDPKETECMVDWYRAGNANLYSRGVYPYRTMVQDGVYFEVTRKPLIIIC